jgi:hypothetical protein
MLVAMGTLFLGLIVGVLLFVFGLLMFGEDY